MGRFFKKFHQRIHEKIKDAIGRITNQEEAQAAFEDQKPDSMRKDIRMISGCEDAQTSADVSNVAFFRLPDPAGRAGGACTSSLLRILYQDERAREDTLSFTEVLELMRKDLGAKGFSQRPQLTSLNKIDVNTDFELVPSTATGVHRAVMIGINYVGQNGELRGCHNDVLNMKKYIMNIHGFKEENIVVLMDDGIHDKPTKSNMIQAYKKIVRDSEDGDAVFLHFSGHGSKVYDNNGDEEDGYDEALIPLDFREEGILRDDDLYDILVEPLAHGVHMVSLMDCCHSGTILDLPYKFLPNEDGSMPEAMQLDDTINLQGLIQQFGGVSITFM